jgi:hypothetical protein
MDDWMMEHLKSGMMEQLMEMSLFELNCIHSRMKSGLERIRHPINRLDALLHNLHCYPYCLVDLTLDDLTSNSYR